MAMADNLENLPLSVIQLNETGTLGDLPVAVLSARRAIPEHVRDASLSTCGEYLIVPDAGHWLQLDAPDAVVDAVRRVVSKVCAA
jgi:pimeloyl-ACP methyl ester carboxylesterase